MAKKPTAGGSLPKNFDPVGRTTYDTSAAAAELAPTSLGFPGTDQRRAADAAAAAAALVDPYAGDNTAKYAADAALTARRAGASAGDTIGSGNDADTLGRPSGGVKRRAAARALLG